MCKPNFHFRTNLIFNIWNIGPIIQKLYSQIISTGLPPVQSPSPVNQSDPVIVDYVSMAIFCLANWLPLYHLASTWLHYHAIPSNLHITMTMLIVRSWIVHLTPIPCSLFQFCPGSHTMCSWWVYLTLLLAHHQVDMRNPLLWAGWNGLPPTPHTLHLGCSYHLHSSFSLGVWLCSLHPKMRNKGPA